MRPVLLLARRELASYLNTAWGYAILAAVLVIDGLLYNAFAVSSAPRFSADVLEFLGAYGFLALITLLTIYMPGLIFVNGKVSWEQIGAGYTGLLALGAATVAIGTFGSSVARNQLVAAVVGGALLVLMLLGWLVSKIADPPLSDVLAYVALFDRHFQPFMRGRINTESLIFFGSVTFGFLMLSVRALQWRRMQ